MNENNGKELVPQRGPPSELSERREYTVNPGRKRGWLDVVGDFIGPPNYDVNLTFTQEMAKDWKQFKQKPWGKVMEVAPIAAFAVFGSCLAMDTYHWDFKKAGDEFLHAMPLGGKLSDMVMNATVPAYRTRPGDSAQETQRRRNCIEGLLFTDTARYEEAANAIRARRGEVTDICEASAVRTSGQQKASAFRK